MKHTLHILAFAALLSSGLQALAQAPVPAAVVTPQPAAKPAQASASAVAGQVASVLTERQRRIIQDYYASHKQRTGRCPPGLAKKNNGCMPPGQAKKWAMGQALPADVAHAPLPEELRKKIGVVQKGIEIVRILNDVVVLNKSNRLVLDAVEVLGQR